MARNPHFKTSFDSTEIERLQKRAEQSGMKRPQDYIRYLVQRDDESMGVHVAFEERDKFKKLSEDLISERNHFRDVAVKYQEFAIDLHNLFGFGSEESIDLEILLQKVNYLEKDIKEKEGALENHRKFSDEIRDICDVPKTDFITFDDLAEKARTLREECGVRGVSERHWKKEFEHQKSEKEQSQKWHCDDLTGLGELLECSGFIGRIYTAIKDLKKRGEKVEILESALETNRQEKYSAIKERDDWAAKANEAAAEAVRIAESIRENEKLADTWKGDVAKALGVQAVTSVMIDAINDRKQDLETTKADLKNTNAAAIENMKTIASSLGVPDTVEHVVQRIGELNDSLKYCVNYGNAMSDICDVIGINSFEDDNLSVIVDKVGELGQHLETAKSDREKVINELKTLGDKWEVKYVEQKKLANDPILKIIWLRISVFFQVLFN